jgi:hypothetical protein
MVDRCKSCLLTKIISIKPVESLNWQRMTFARMRRVRRESGTSN